MVGAMGISGCGCIHQMGGKSSGIARGCWLVGWSLEDCALSVPVRRQGEQLCPC